MKNVLQRTMTTIALIVAMMTAAATVQAQNVEYYNLWVGRKQVTSENCTNISASGGFKWVTSGKASYDPNTKTLILENAKIEFNIESYIDNLKILVYGMRCSVDWDIIFHRKGAIIQGDGKLLVKRGIVADDDLRIEKLPNRHFTVDVRGHDFSGRYMGLKANYLRISGTTVNLDVNVPSGFKKGLGVLSTNSLELNDCGLKSPKEAFFDFTLGTIVNKKGNPLKRVTFAPGGSKFPSTSYIPLAINGVQVTPDNCSNITGPGISGSVSFDPSGNTLTLRNATIDFTNYSTSLDLNPFTDFGNNYSIHCIKTALYQLRINIEGVCNIVSDGNRHTNNIFFYEPISGISAWGNVRINTAAGATLNIKNFVAGISLTGVGRALETFGDGTINIESKSRNNSKVATGILLRHDNRLSIGSNLNIKNRDSQAVGIRGDKTYKWDEEGYGFSEGSSYHDNEAEIFMNISAHHVITIDAGNRLAVERLGKLSLRGRYMTDPIGGKLSPWGTIIDINGKDANKVRITGGYDIKKYELYINGTQIDDNNCRDLRMIPGVTVGSGDLACYRPGSKTLHLANTGMESEQHSCIHNKGIDNLEIFFKGKNYISATGKYRSGILLEAPTVISGSSHEDFLKIKGKSEGIYVDATTLTIKPNTQVHTKGVNGITGSPGGDKSVLVVEAGKYRSLHAEGTYNAITEMRRVSLEAGAGFIEPAGTVWNEWENGLTDVRGAFVKRAVVGPVTDFGLVIGHTRLHSSNYYALNLFPRVHGDVSYNPATNTLHLKNGQISLEECGVRSEKDDLKINIEGDFDIYAHREPALFIGGKATVSGKGTLVLKSGEEADAAGVVIGKNAKLFLEGDCNVKVESLSENAKGITGYNNGNSGEMLSIRKATLHAKGKAGSIGGLTLDLASDRSVLAPVGAVWNKEKKAVVDAQGKIVTEQVTIGKTGTSSIGEVSAVALTLYPNPVESILHIEAEGEVRSIRIYNIYGTEVATATATKQIDLSHLPAGVYALRVETERGVATQRVVKK